MSTLFWVINATNHEGRTGFRKTQETMKGLPEVHLHNLRLTIMVEIHPAN